MLQYTWLIHLWCILLAFAFLKLSNKFLLLAFAQFFHFINFGHFGQWQFRMVKFLISHLPISWKIPAQNTIAYSAHL
jgi:hypothetical protein